MRSRTTADTEIDRLLRLVTATGPGSPDDQQKLQLLESLRGLSPEAPKLLDLQILRRLSALTTESAERNQALEKLRSVVERLTAPPLHPVTLLGLDATGAVPSAMVLHGSTRRVVGIVQEAEEALRDAAPGDEVLLAADLNVVLARSSFGSSVSGETAIFDRALPDGRLVMRWRDEEIILYAAGTLDVPSLRPGDSVRWRREAWMAFERIERSTGEHRFLEETPSDTFDEIGGLDAQIERLQWMFLMRMEHAATAGEYGVRPPRSVLLSGKPGNGKTKLARALARWISERTPSGRTLFMNIKPSGLHSMWHGQSEANFREAFRVARETAEREDVPVVMFFDEVDSSASMRGGSANRVDDRVASSFMAELDGLEGRGNVFVIAATNRTDIIDAALTRPGRLGDVQLHIPRPGRDGGRQILSKYLVPDLPFAPFGDDEGESDPRAVRERLLDAVVSRVYAPNGEGVLSKVTLRSGKKLDVRPGDLVSGALLARLAATATESACRRHIETGRRGIRLSDLLAATDEVLQQAARMLTPANCRQYLDHVPQDDDVVGVDPVRPRTARSHRYLKIA